MKCDPFKELYLILWNDPHGKRLKNSGEVKVAESCLTLCDPMDLYSTWNSPDQNTGVGNLSLLQGIFPTYRIKPGSPALWADSLPTELSGKPLKRVDMCVTDLLRCTVQTNNIVYQVYSNKN